MQQYDDTSAARAAPQGPKMADGAYARVEVMAPLRPMELMRELDFINSQSSAPDAALNAYVDLLYCMMMIS